MTTIVNSTNTETERILFIKVNGIFCFACTEVIKLIIEKLDGVAEANVNYAASLLVVKLNKSIDPAIIIESLEKNGYGGELVEKPETVFKRENNSTFRKRILICFLLSVLVVTNPWYCLNKYLQFIIATICLVIGGKDIYNTAFHSINTGKANMAVLIMISTSLAYLYSSFVVFFGQIFHIEELYYECCCTVLVFVLISQYMENNARHESSFRIDEMFSIIPSKVHKVVGDGVIEEDITKLVSGDIYQVKSGEVFPLDGVIVKGSTEIDDSTLTGETSTKVRTVGDEIQASNINHYNDVLVRVTASTKETLYFRIIANTLIAMADNDSDIQSFTDRISSIFIKTVLGLSLLTFIIWAGWIMPGKYINAFVKAITVIIVACPCTLGLSVALAMSVGMSYLIKSGVYVKNQSTIENLSKVRKVYFDKTGTLTSDIMNDVIIEADNVVTENVVALEKNTNHPIANRISADERYAKYGKKDVSDYKYENGHLSGIVDGKLYEIQVESKGEESYSAIYENGIKVGRIIFEERIREGSYRLIEYLHKLGIKPVLLSGDNSFRCNAVAEELGIDEVYSKLLPQEKDQLIKENKGGDIVAMVGDGLNDFPSFVSSDVSVAIGKISSLQLDVADVVITKNRILDCLKAVFISKSVMKNIKVALILSLMYNTSSIIFAMAGILTPVLAATLMSLSSLGVVINARKLRDDFSDISFAKIERYSVKK